MPGRPPRPRLAGSSQQQKKRALPPKHDPPKHELTSFKTEKRQAAREAIDATNMSREAALAFLEADVNGDGVLEFEEFKECILKLQAKTGAAMSAEDERSIRELFDSIDMDKSGTIEMDEYFIFSLDIASSQGCGLETIFRKYDATGEGHLDANEFASAVEDLGFSTTFAHDLFVDLDDDNSGTVDCNEISAALKERVKSMDEDTKRFLTTLAFSDADKWKQSQQVEANSGGTEIVSNEATLERLNKTTAAEQLKGPDSDSLRVQLQQVLKANSLRESDMYNLLVMPLVKGDVTQDLTKDVFIAGLNRLGYSGPPGMLVTLFKKIDSE